MSVPTGTVVLVPFFNQTLNLMPASTAPVTPVLGLGPSLTRWNITPVIRNGTTLYVLNLVDRPESKVVVKDGLLFTSINDPPAEFSVQASNGGTFGFFVPGTENRWVLDVPNEPVRVAGPKGADNERWFVTPVP